MRATLRRLSAHVPDDENSLRLALAAALRTARTPLLRGLLFERGGSCAGCSERAEYVQAVVASLSSPLIGRHALPLFLYNQPLFPHTLTGLNLFEPRYKLLCRKALKADGLFGFVSGDVGTLAKIKASRFSDDDAVDGSCRMSVLGLRRFKLGRQWQESCAGCDTGPLHYADVLYYNDTAAPSSAAALVKESLRLHYELTTSQSQTELAAQLGDTPTTRDQGYAMSMWLAAACVAQHERCKAQATLLLSGTSTAERLERIINVQKALVGGKYARRAGSRRQPK